jgi:FAD/FMN-containing dehydrogenase/Fe-S oxidoreductase
VRDDLKGLVRGDLLFDDLSRALYSTDASLFQVTPLGVVAPRDEDDLRVIVRYAAEHRLPLVPRGAGTGVAGESLGPGLVLDFSRHFRAIGPVGPDTVIAQPGVVLRHLNDRLAQVGRRFAPDPASADTCTVGGLLANNASGRRAVRFGYTRDYVRAARVVLDTGAAAAVGVEPLPGPDPKADESRLQSIVRATADLVAANRELIDIHRPRARFNRCGYLLGDVLTPAGLDLPRLLCGSEGTLALFTEATLATVPLPGGRSAALFGFASLDAALRAALDALPCGPSACDLLDRRLLSLARRSDPGHARMVPSAVEAALLVEFEADTEAEARDRARELTDRLTHAGNGRAPLLATPAFEPEAVDRLWALRDVALPTLYALGRGPRPVAVVEDVAVPVEELPRYVSRVQDILQRHETIASFLVHAGAGQVHTRPFLDMERPEDVAKLRSIAEEVHAAALELGGTVSSQHGTGLARTPWVARQYGPLTGVFRELKRIFDPADLFNPGKIVGPDPSRPEWPLLAVVSRQSSVVGQDQPTDDSAASGLPTDDCRLTTSLRWQPGELTAQVAACNGCGSCRAEVSPVRMCPVFHATHAEAATPRAKANLLRHLLGPGGGPKRLSDDDVRAVASLCVNCKQCARECPAHVNVPKLMLEAKAAHTAEHGLDRSDWVLARTEAFAAIGSALAPLINPLLNSRLLRWLAERFFGVSRRRRLPLFARRSFLARASRRGLTQKPSIVHCPSSLDESGDQGPRTKDQGPRTKDKVAYFVDVFANYNDPSIAEAAVAVLRHNGVAVYVPPEQRGCGMAALAQGDVDSAREAVLQNLRVFADLAREGYRIVCSEPTAALMLTQDALDLIDDADTRLVAEHTVELTAFLAELHGQGRLRTDFQPLDMGVGHHVPCHLKALGQPAAGPGLLALIPRLRVHTIDVSCSGMAGTYGLKAENYAASLAAGRPMLEELRRPRVLFGSTECSSCRMQMEEGAGKRTLHPVQYLALAYGLMPDLARRLREPIRTLSLR